MKFFVWHCQAIKLAFKRLGQFPLNTLLSLLAMGVAFAVPGVIFLLIVSAENLLTNQQNLNQQTINIFLKKTNDAKIDAKNYEFIVHNFLLETSKKYLADSANNNNSINPQKNLQISWKFIPKNQAFEIVKQDLNLPMLDLSLFPENPLPDSVEILIENGNFSVFQNLLNDIDNAKNSNINFGNIIEFVQSDGQWQQQLEQFLQVGKILLMILSCLFAIGLIAIIFNAIRTQVISNFDEIEISLFIGATKDYIARPFYYFGIFASLLGTIVGICFLQIALYFLRSPLGELSEMLQLSPQFNLENLNAQIIIVMCVIAILLGGLGAFLSVNLNESLKK